MDNRKKLSKAKVAISLPTRYVETESKSAAFLARINAAVGKETAAFIMESTGNPDNAATLPH